MGSYYIFSGFRLHYLFLLHWLLYVFWDVHYLQLHQQSGNLQVVLLNVSHTILLAFSIKEHLLCGLLKSICSTLYFTISLSCTDLQPPVSLYFSNSVSIFVDYSLQLCHCFRFPLYFLASLSLTVNPSFVFLLLFLPLHGGKKVAAIIYGIEFWER